MIGGYVLDPATIGDFGRDELRAVQAVYELDMAAQAIIVPMTAMAEALTGLETPEQIEQALFLLDLGVVVPDDLTRDNTASVATVQLTAKAETTLGTAHTVVAAQRRAARVVSTRPKTWAAAHPEVEVAALEDPPA